MVLPKYAVAVCFFLLLPLSYASWDSHIMAYYNLSDDGDVRDISSANHGKLDINGATYDANGKMQGMYCFDGNDYLNDSHWSDTANAHSIAFWFKRSASVGAGTNQNIVQARNNDGSHATLIDWRTEGELYCRKEVSTSTQNARVTNTEYDDDTNWHHAVYTSSANSGQGGMNWYVDGGLVGTSSAQSESNTGAMTFTTLYVGARYVPDRYLDDVCIDEVVLFDIELSSTNVTDLYNGGSGFNPYYVPPVSTGWEHCFLGVCGDSIGRLNGVLYANIGKVNGV